MIKEIRQKILEMKKFRLIIFLVTGLIFLNSCGKPTDPESMNSYESAGYKIISRYTTIGYAQDVIVKDTLAYLAQGEGGLLIVNISDPENPVLVSSTTDNVRGYCNRIIMKENTVYLAAGSFGVNVLNVANPSLPVVTAANLSIKPARSFHIMGNFMFTAISEQGFNVCEISNPNQPNIRGETRTLGYARGTITTADSLYLLVACGEMGLSIFDISHFENGYGTYPLTGFGNTPGYAEEVAVADNDSIAYMACGTAGLQIVNYADSSNVHVVGSYNGGGYAKDLIYTNDLIFLVTEQRGLQIINVADVTAPYLLGSISTEYALGIDMDEKYIYIADEDEGLIIISRPE